MTQQSNGSASLDLTSTGSPELYLTLPPKTCEACLDVYLYVEITDEVPGSGGTPANDFTSDSFKAAAVADKGCRKEIELSVAAEYDPVNDWTLLKVTFPTGCKLKNRGRFGLRWDATTGGKRWLVVGTYVRSNLIPG